MPAPASRWCGDAARVKRLRPRPGHRRRGRHSRPVSCRRARGAGSGRVFCHGASAGRVYLLTASIGAGSHWPAMPVAIYMPRVDLVGKIIGSDVSANSPDDPTDVDVGHAADKKISGASHGRPLRQIASPSRCGPGRDRGFDGAAPNTSTQGRNRLVLDHGRLGLMTT
jgi:hypothetical protein